MIIVEIIADIRRRMKNYPKWSGSSEKQAAKPQSTSSSASTEKMPPRRLRRNSRAETSPLGNEKNTPTIVPRRSSRKSKSTESARKSLDSSISDITLCLSDEKYKEVIWRYYDVIGKNQLADEFNEEKLVHEIFQLLKKRLGKGGRFFRKIVHDDLLCPVDDEGALKSECGQCLDFFYFNCPLTLYCAL
jgi:hypothetical protein